jgi:L-lysine exporter family protein LysE/ArgO
MELGGLAKWIGVGLGAAAPIGPVNIEIARRSIRSGYLAGVLLGCGAVTVDVAYCVVASLWGRWIGQYVLVLRALMVIGAMFLAWLGVMALRSAWRSVGFASADRLRETPENNRFAEADPTGPPASRHYLSGVLMTSVNPMTLAFWFLATPAIAGSHRWSDILPRCGGVAIGAGAWVVFFAALMRFAGRMSRRWTELGADIAGGVMLLGFAGYAIWRLLRGHL